MNDKEKAALVLNILEDYDSKVVLDTLNPYLKDSDLAELYDELAADGIIR